MDFFLSSVCKLSKGLHFMLYPHPQPHTQKIYHALFVTMKYLEPVLSNVWSQFYGCLKWWCLLITTVQMHFKYHPQIYFHNAYLQWHHCAVLFIHLFFSYLLNNHKLLNELYLHCFQLLSCDYHISPCFTGASECSFELSFGFFHVPLQMHFIMTIFRECFAVQTTEQWQ